MSGTSLDGLDIAFCKFKKIELNSSQWFFEIIDAKTIKYPENWLHRLRNAQNLNAYDFIKLDNEYGEFIGNQIKLFTSKLSNIDFVASHGHTIFHNPDEKITCQIGSGASIASNCGIATIADFRTTDLALGGQGAPLVPIGDKLLFSDYDFCLNLGGFSNISFQKDSKRIAFDISPVNFAANYYSQKKNLLFDKAGKLGEQGVINNKLFVALNSLYFYKLPAPKSLSREWFEDNFLPIVESFNISIYDKLRTIYEHISVQISDIINKNINKKNTKTLITGGGAYNHFLIKLIKKHCNSNIIVPKNIIIDYKEALIFAFLGVLRFQNKTNCLSSVTGAKKDNIGGAVWK